MPTIYNCAPYALVINPNELAIDHGGSIEVSDEEAVSLCEGPDWSLTPPAKAKGRVAIVTPDTDTEPATPGEIKE